MVPVIVPDPSSRGVVDVGTKWWHEDIEQISINISFSQPPIREPQIALTSKVPINQSNGKREPPYPKSSVSSETPNLASSMRFEKELVGNASPPSSGLEYPFVKPGLRKNYDRMEILLINDDENECGPERTN